MADKYFLPGRDTVVTVLTTLIEPGTPTEIKSRWGEPRMVKIGREWQVTTADGEELGFIGYEMLTRERTIPGKRYVAARWQSPGWVIRDRGQRYGRRTEVTSKTRGVERLFREANQ